MGETVALTASAHSPARSRTTSGSRRRLRAGRDLGATTTSPTKQVTSATRGTRKFRVVASHAVVASAESAPVYVTWDEWDIVANMIGELSLAVASSTAYLRDQAALMGCMRATSPGSGDGRSVTGPLPATIATFDDLLGSYTGDTSSRMWRTLTR